MFTCPHGPDPPPPLWTSIHGRHEESRGHMLYILTSLNLSERYQRVLSVYLFPRQKIYPFIKMTPKQIWAIRRSNIYNVNKKIRFLTPLPLSTCVHMGRTLLPPCGSPHAVDVKHTALLKWLAQ